ncbi:MAG: ImmA/IrrE family metallo-endopeptidase [Desulfobacteraceae bacterium]|nr:MAG: ImmA/IrrE family metallo-endopeptidase [Desulfobacteraceae bacterium]
MTRRLVPAKPRSNADIESMALNIVLKYQPSVLSNEESFDIERFFDCDLEKITQVEIDYKPLEAGIYGYTDSENMECVISSDLIDSPHQQNFCRSTMAHESAHAMMHVHDYRLQKAILKSIHKHDHAIKMYREKDIITYRNPEWQAWRFAGALLMPESAIRNAIAKGKKTDDLSEQFGVNPSFVRSRLKVLKVFV